MLVNLSVHKLLLMQPIISNFKKYDGEKTKYIFLYEAMVYDQENEFSFTVTNMLSERHSNVAIFNWLANWKNSDVPMPKNYSMRLVIGNTVSSGTMFYPVLFATSLY